MKTVALFFMLLVLQNTLFAKYDEVAKNTYSHNDVKAFVYKWFAGFDHQAKASVFTQHLNPKNVTMHFPNNPINSVEDFERWYEVVVKTIAFNTHELLYLDVKGNEEEGFFVELVLTWQARSYD